MKTEFEVWKDELSGKRSNRSSWWLVLAGAVIVAVALAFLR